MVQQTDIKSCLLLKTKCKCSENLTLIFLIYMEFPFLGASAPGRKMSNKSPKCTSRSRSRKYQLSNDYRTSPSRNSWSVGVIEDGICHDRSSQRFSFSLKQCILLLWLFDKGEASQSCSQKQLPRINWCPCMGGTQSLNIRHLNLDILSSSSNCDVLIQEPLSAMGKEVTYRQSLTLMVDVTASAIPNTSSATIYWMSFNTTSATRANLFRKLQLS